MKAIFYKSRWMFFFLGTIFLIALLVSLTFQWTQPQIAENQHQVKEALLTELIPNMHLERPLNETATKIDAPAGWPSQIPLTIYHAIEQGKVQAIIIEGTSAKGYSGNITLLIAISTNNKVIAARSLLHHETPGLGDKMELKNSDWILSFNDQQYNQARHKDWQVKKYGGQFDSWTGATITPTAIIELMAASLKFTQHNHDELFSFHD